MSVPFKADVKAAAKKLAEILNEKYSKEIKHGHALDIVSAALGIRDWNTMSAMTKEGDSAGESHKSLSTVGDLVAYAASLQSLPPALPLYTQYNFDVEDFDQDGGYQSSGTRRTKGIVASNSSEGVVFDVIDPNDWEILRETTESFPGGNVTRIGLDQDDFLKFVLSCEKEINSIAKQRLADDIRINLYHADQNAILVRQIKFDLAVEVHKADSEMGQYYGVSWSHGKDGFRLVESEGGNREGFLEELRGLFAQREEQRAFKFFDKFGFTNQFVNWHSPSELLISAKQSLNELTFKGNLEKLLGAVRDEEAARGGEQWMKMQEDLKRGK